jgi:hypothetical protein
MNSVFTLLSEHSKSPKANILPSQRSLTLYSGKSNYSDVANLFRMIPFGMLIILFGLLIPKEEVIAQTTFGAAPTIINPDHLRLDYSTTNGRVYDIVAFEDYVYMAGDFTEV